MFLGENTDISCIAYERSVQLLHESLHSDTLIEALTASIDSLGLTVSTSYKQSTVAQIVFLE